MAKRCVGFTVTSNKVTIVDALVPEDDADPITILSDHTWDLQSGDKGNAYWVMHQRCAGYLRENAVKLVVVKASALATGSTKLAHLHSAELRGVIIAAAASVCTIEDVTKALISRTYGERKVDEYISDDTFWTEHTEGGKLRKSSREAAMLIIARRNA